MRSHHGWDIVGVMLRMPRLLCIPTIYSEKHWAMFAEDIHLLPAGIVYHLAPPTGRKAAACQDLF